MLFHNSLTQFVRELLTNTEGALTIGELYEAVERDYLLTDFQKDFDEGNEPRFHHEIRAIINQFMDDGEIIRVGRGLYRKARN